MTKLVEVALPLEEISAACKRDKDKKTGTIKNVHKWFAPMPTPAWRALLFATLVDDPGDEEKRAELLEFVKELVPADGNPPSQAVLDRAKEMLAEATGGNPPTVFDPFCGGGSTLVEAQRLGLPCAGSDLNPVPVLITRTLTELLPQVAGRPPLVEDSDTFRVGGGGPYDGILADCRRYAERIRAEVWDQIGHLYPTPPGGGTVVAWLWARTVVCPNPACRAIAPLVSSFWLSKKKGAHTWIELTDLRPGQPVRFEVRTGDSGPPPATKIGRGGTFRCAVCRELIPETHVKAEGMAGRLSTQLMAVAVDGDGGRSYLSPTPDLWPPSVDRPADAPVVELPDDTRAFWSKLYGQRTYADVFTDRQLVALGAFADAVRQVPEWVVDDGGDEAQAKATASVLGLCVSKLAMACSTQARWFTREGPSKAVQAFSRHALPMVWDFAEANPFGGSVGDWLGQLVSARSGIRSLPMSRPSAVLQSDARVSGGQLEKPALVATDPPYFAQIGYADLSDYFYVWLRRSLAAVHSDLFATVATPKADELIAAPYRHHGSLKEATDFFVSGYTKTFRSLSSKSSPTLPMLVVYAHKQEETEGDDGVTSTGWDAMLSAIIAAGQRIVGTWPIRSAHSSKQIGIGTNSLASYMVLVCRPQVVGAKATDRQGFLAALHSELPKAIRKVQQGDISTIDLGPAAIGPGMEVFSRFSRVIEPSGKPMTVGGALALIAEVTGEVLDEFVGDLDGETRWAMGWFRDHGFGDGSFDDAEKLFRAMVTSMDGVERAGVAVSARGRVRLLARAELSAEWSPASDRRITVWEVTQHLAKRLEDGGEDGAARLLATCGRWADAARDLAQWLAKTAIDTGRPVEALTLDALVTSWSELQRRADRVVESTPVAGRFAGMGD